MKDEKRTLSKEDLLQAITTRCRTYAGLIKLYPAKAVSNGQLVTYLNELISSGSIEEHVVYRRGRRSVYCKKGYTHRLAHEKHTAAYIELQINDLKKTLTTQQRLCTVKKTTKNIKCGACKKKLSYGTFYISDYAQPITTKYCIPCWTKEKSET